LPPVDYLLIGHVTLDLLPGGEQRLGGTAAYAALAAQALGRRVGIVTSAPATLDLTALGTAVVVPAPAATTFENRYLPEGRRQLLHALAAPLTVASVPPAWRAAPLVHLGPVMGECAVELVAYFAERAAFVGLTPQGWLRRARPGGWVTVGTWEAAPQVLPLASAVVLSIEDLSGSWERAETYAALTRILVVTEGAAGGLLFRRGEPPLRFAASAVQELDPTGAGDIFAAVFFSLLAAGLSPEKAVQQAAQFAAISVKRPGLEGVPQPAEVVAMLGEGERR